MAEIEVPANERSRRTRRALLDATRALIVEQGFDTLTMASVANRAGVTRGAVYMHFDSAAALIAAMFDHVADVEGLADSVSLVWQAPDSVAALDAWAAHLADYHTRVMAFDQALQRVESTDNTAAAHRARVNAAQMANCERLAQWLADENRLAASWDVESAVDLLYGLISSDLFSRLIHGRGWSLEQLGDRLGLLLRSTLTRRPS